MNINKPVSFWVWARSKFPMRTGKRSPPPLYGTYLTYMSLLYTVLTTVTTFQAQMKELKNVSFHPSLCQRSVGSCQWTKLDDRYRHECRWSHDTTRKSMHDDLSIKIYIWEDGNCFHHRMMWTLGVVGHTAQQLRHILYHLGLCVHWFYTNAWVSVCWA